jgi:hypothetical protein
MKNRDLKSKHNYIKIHELSFNWVILVKQLAKWQLFIKMWNQFKVYLMRWRFMFYGNKY